MEQGGNDRDPVVVFRKTKTRGNPVNGRADAEGVFLLQVKTVLMHGVRFLEGQEMMFKPVLKKMELLVVHAEGLCLGRKWTLALEINFFWNGCGLLKKVDRVERSVYREISSLSKSAMTAAIF